MVKSKSRDGSKLRSFITIKQELVKVSPLTYEAVCPTPIERQKLKTCLRVFCDKINSALKKHSEFDNALGTIDFLANVLEF